jgi:DNA-binding transcriptional ArsR family regulator
MDRTPQACGDTSAQAEVFCFF